MGGGYPGIATAQACFTEALQTGQGLGGGEIAKARKDQPLPRRPWQGTLPGQAYAAENAPGGKGELDPGTVQVDGLDCRTVWSLLVDRVREKTLDEYADICGIEVDRIIDTARDFSAAGKRSLCCSTRAAPMCASR